MDNLCKQSCYLMFIFKHYTRNSLMWILLVLATRLLESRIYGDLVDELVMGILGFNSFAQDHEIT